MFARPSPPSALLVLVSCAALGSAACAGAAAAAGAPITYDDGKKRETEQLKPFKVTLAHSRDVIEVDALVEPKVTVDEEGGTKVDITYAKDEPPLQCLVAPRFVTAGALLRNVANSLLSTSKPKGYLIGVAGTPQAPSLSMKMLLEVPEDGKAVLVEWKVALAYFGSGTVLCQTATVGYDGTLQRIFDKLRQSSFAKTKDAPVYADLSVAKKGDFVVGFEWTRAYAEAGELRTVAYTSVFGMGTEGFLGVDQVIAETTSDKGELLVHIHASDSRTSAQTLTIRSSTASDSKIRSSKGAVFELTIGEEEAKGSVDGLPTSVLQRANTLKRVAKGSPRPGVLRVTDVGGGVASGNIVTIKDVAVTREGERSVILAESDGHMRCEVDDDGRCSKYSKGSLTFERLARFGQFPKVP